MSQTSIDGVEVTVTTCPDGSDIANGVCVVKFDLAKALFAYSTDAMGNLVATGAVPIVAANVPITMSGTLMGFEGHGHATGQVDEGRKCTATPSFASVGVVVTLAPSPSVDPAHPPVLGCSPATVVSVVVDSAGVAADSIVCNVTCDDANCNFALTEFSDAITDVITSQFSDSLAATVAATIGDAIGSQLCLPP